MAAFRNAEKDMGHFRSEQFFLFNGGGFTPCFVTVFGQDASYFRSDSALRALLLLKAKRDSKKLKTEIFQCCIVGEKKYVVQLALLHISLGTSLAGQLNVDDWGL